VGAFFQNAEFSTDETPTVKSIGLDIALFYTPSSMPRFCPYLRATYNLYDNIRQSHGYNFKKQGNGLGIGLGIEYAILPSMRLFAEYMLSFREYGSKYRRTDVGYHPVFQQQITATYTATCTKKNISSINFGVTYAMGGTDRSGRDGEQERLKKEQKAQAKEQKEREMLNREQREKESREREERRAW